LTSSTVFYEALKPLLISLDLLVSYSNNSKKSIDFNLSVYPSNILLLSIKASLSKMLCCGAFVEKSFFENIGVNGSLMI
jgi:hypothetical protein